MSDDLYSPSWYRVAELRPRLRGHVRVHRHHYRGDTWYVLEDRVSGRMHRFNPVAHYVIGLMDGRRSVQDLWEAAAGRFGDDAPTQNDMIGVLGQLHAADVLQSEVTPDVAELLRRAQVTRRRGWMQKYLSPLALRFPLYDPDRLLERWLPWYRWLFSWTGAVLWCAVVGAAAVGAAMHWSELTEDLSGRVLSPGNLLILFLVFPVIKLLHEFGHACAAKAWGAEVHEMGVMLLVLMPIPYVDASAASAFRRVRQRFTVGAAGMIVEVFVASIAFFLWTAVEPGLTRAVLYNVMLIAGVSTVVFNINPLLRFDGYYMLADLLQIPNLRARGQRYLGSLVESRVFGVRQPPFEAARGEQGWLLAFTVGSFIYRMAVMLAIALFIGTQYFFVGVLLALFVVVTSLVLPLARAVAYLAAHPRLRRRRARAIAISAALAGTVGVGLFAVPLPLWTIAQGITWAPDDATVVAGADGFVRAVAAPPGGVVRRGAPLLVTDDPLLALRADVLEAELRLLSIRAHAELQEDRVRAELTREQMASVQAELALVRERAAALVIPSPADGIFVLPSAQDLEGRFVRQGQQVGFVVRPDTITLKVLVPQEDAALVAERTAGVEVKLAGRLFETIHAVMRRQIPAATNRLPNPALASIGGGVVPVEPHESGAPTALQGWFELELDLPATHTYAVGERAHVRFDHGREPLAWRLYRSVRQLFLRHFTL